jgi:hypothetical protein
MGTSGGTFVNAVMNLGFHKMQEIYCLAEELLAFQGGLGFMELIRYIAS